MITTLTLNIYLLMNPLHISFGILFSFKNAVVVEDT